MSAAGSSADGVGRSGANTVLIALFLIAVPLVSAYIAFKITAGESLFPLELGSFFEVIFALTPPSGLAGWFLGGG